ncbi:MAG: hypothetical protein H7263_06705 [Candidatus Sericytochromatia bacterium]|nr:hypothetical protein [Candidatus Sericytochromatia bacterium]
MKINIVLIEPPNFEHSRVYEEIITLYYECIKDLGHEVIKSINIFKQDYLNIIIAYQFLEYFPQMSQLKYIVVQLEQLSFSGGWFDNKKDLFINRFIPLLKNALDIWDYSLENVKFMNKYNLNSTLIPFGFHEIFKTIKHADNKDIDVLFYGSTHQRRWDIIEKLREKCNVKSVMGIYGYERGELISRSKVIINIHAYENLKILEQVRLFYLLSNKCFIISENSESNPYKDGFVTLSYSQLVERTIEWLKKDEERNKVALKGFDIVKSIDTKGLINSSLNKLKDFIN